MRCSQITQHAEIGDITLFLQILSERGTEESEIARWGLNGVCLMYPHFLTISTLIHSFEIDRQDWQD